MKAFKPSLTKSKKVAAFCQGSFFCDGWTLPFPGWVAALAIRPEGVSPELRAAANRLTAPRFGVSRLYALRNGV
jgi:hypothetical protein